jgi:hypothetical protein
MKSEKESEIIEAFPAWQESRKLLNLIRNIKIRGEENSDKLLFRSTAVSRAEGIFYASAEAFGHNKRGGYCRAGTVLDELIKFKTAIYMLFDRGRICRDDFSEILIQTSRLINVFEDMAEEALKQRKSRKMDKIENFPDCESDIEEQENKNIDEIE